MKRTLLAASILAVFSAPTFADEAFDGAYVGLSAGFANNSADYKATQNSKTIGQVNLGKTGRLGGQVFAGYSQSFDKNFNLAANTFFNFSQANAGEFSDNGVTGKAKLRKIWGAVVEPGFYLGEKTLGYAKLGWARGQASIEDSSKNVNGIVYGLGIKHLITSNIYVGAEFQKIDFRKASFDKANRNLTVDPIQTFAGVSVGYKF